MILTVPRNQLPTLPTAGCWAVASFDFLHRPVWQARTDVEQDETWVQPIPYLVLCDSKGGAWCYRRTGGDARLDGRSSCGVGGHVDDTDAPGGETFDADATLRRALMRELAEELGGTASDWEGLRSRGLVFEGHPPVGRVHLGVLYSARWISGNPPVPQANEALTSIGFMPLTAIAADTQFELWSRLAAQFLAEAAV